MKSTIYEFISVSVNFTACIKFLLSYDIILFDLNQQLVASDSGDRSMVKDLLMRGSKTDNL